MIYTGYEGLTDDEVIRLVEDSSNGLANEIMRRAIASATVVEERDDCIKELEKHIEELHNGAELTKMQNDLDAAHDRLKASEEQACQFAKEARSLAARNVEYSKQVTALISEKEEAIRQLEKRLRDAPATW